jgi:hypothetical protein
VRIRRRNDAFCETEWLRGEAKAFLRFEPNFEDHAFDSRPRSSAAKRQLSATDGFKRGDQTPVATSLASWCFHVNYSVGAIRRRQKTTVRATSRLRWRKNSAFCETEWLRREDKVFLRFEPNFEDHAFDGQPRQWRAGIPLSSSDGFDRTIRIMIIGPVPTDNCGQ